MISKLLIVIASVCLVGCATTPTSTKRQQPSVSIPGACRDLGQSQHPRIAAGIYYISHLDSALYHASTRGTKPRLVSGADWSGTQSVTALGNWLYIVQDGKLHRVHPQTGEWFPKNFETGDCSWYAGWSGPVWAAHGNLYTVARNPAGKQQLLRLDFLRRRSTVIADYNLPVGSVVPSLSTEVRQ